MAVMETGVLRKGDMVKDGEGLCLCSAPPPQLSITNFRQSLVLSYNIYGLGSNRMLPLNFNIFHILYRKAFRLQKVAYILKIPVKKPILRYIK